MAKKKTTTPKPISALQLALHIAEIKRGRFLSTLEVMKVFEKNKVKIRNELNAGNTIRGSARKPKVKAKKARKSQSAGQTTVPAATEETNGEG